MSADRIVMAASKLLGATAACVILSSFAAGHRKLYWNGCIKSARVICQRIFPILAEDFSFKTLFKKCFKIVFFFLWRRDPVLELQFPALLRVVLFFCNSVSADRIVMAASRLLGATAACAILLSFAAGHGKSWWSGCIKAAIVF